MKSLEDITIKYNINFNDNDKYLKEIILEMYNNSNIDINNYDLDNCLILNLIGQYYNFININYNEMIKYYLMAIDI